MKKVFAVIVAFMLTTFSIAQEWVEHAGIEYNCDVLNGILEDLAKEFCSIYRFGNYRIE